MPVEVQCPCGSRLSVPRKLVGKGVVICPKCGASIFAEAQEAAVDSICEDSLRTLAAQGIEAGPLPLANAPPPPLAGAPARRRVEIVWGRLALVLLGLAFLGGAAIVGWRAAHHVAGEVSDDLATDLPQPVAGEKTFADEIAAKRQADIRRQAAEAERDRRRQNQRVVRPTTRAPE